MPIGPAVQRLKRISYGANAAGFRSTQQRSQNMRKHVGMFVAIKMR